jgi:hypothetical protein
MQKGRIVLTMRPFSCADAGARHQSEEQLPVTEQ